jgi:RES domain-containing protein
MIVYRLSKERFKDDLSGDGAAKFGSRWNSEGISMIYTGQSRALCAAEVAVHIPIGVLPNLYYMISIYIPDEEPVAQLSIDELPSDWNDVSGSTSTQSIGDLFVREKKYLLMKVPSAVIKGDFNYLINPAHPSIAKVKIITTELFPFDKRLFKK